MGGIKTVEIICKPCHRCEVIGQQIQTILSYMERQMGLKIKYELTYNRDLREADKHGFSISQLPIVLINNNVEFVGRSGGEHVIRMKLEEIIRHT